MTKRHFYRCNDCLTVVATETKLKWKWNENYTGQFLDAVCACGGTFQEMGETTAYGTLRQEVGHVTPCDSRCTGALGPNCDCPCGGENHGKGITVPVYTDGPIPRVGTPDKAIGKATEFRAVCAEYMAYWQAQYGHLQDDRSAGRWLTPEMFRKLCDGEREYASFIKAKGMKVHASRMKAIRKLGEAVSA
jgi:hypothetical protein